MKDIKAHEAAIYFIGRRHGIYSLTFERITIDIFEYFSEDVIWGEIRRKWRLALYI